MKCSNYPDCGCERDRECIDAPPRRPFMWIMVFAILAVCCISIVLLVWTTPINAHEAIPTSAQPQGWRYPYSCCSGVDCRAVRDADIGERPEGYVIKRTGEVISMSDSRIRHSPDGVFHWCSVAGANDGRTICLFVPPRSF